MTITEEDAKSVLFVCMGNICRSPAAEGVFTHLVNKSQPKTKIKIDSAGTIGYHEGNAADHRMQQAAKARGFDLTSRARKVTKKDMEEFDLVIAMDRENLSDLKTIAGEQFSNKIKMLSEFIPPGTKVDVPDPYYGGGKGFEVVLDMIESACPNVLAHLTESNGPKQFI